VTAVGLLWASEQGMAVGATAVADMWVVTALTAGRLVEVEADCGWATRLLPGVLTGAVILLVVGVRSILSSRAVDAQRSNHVGRMAASST